MRIAARRRQCRHFIWCFFVSLVVILPLPTESIDLITTTQFLTKNQLLVSPGERFALGFFKPGAADYWYIGIWYKDIEVQTVVWVANRDAPLGSNSGILKIGAHDGALVLADDAGNPVWSANHSSTENTVAELLDSGNFVLRRKNDLSPENYLWQSFDHPTDNLLAGMKLGWDSRTGLNRYLHAWKNSDDPSSGDYKFKLNMSGFPEIYMTNGGKITYRSGPWNGIGFSGVPEMKPSPIVSFLFKVTPEEVYYSFDLKNKTIRSRLMVSTSGALVRLTWIPTSKIWSTYLYAKDQCDSYRQCGAFGICDTNESSICKCMKGFEPKNPQAWNLRDGSDGCVRVSKLDCKNDGFLPLNNVKLPESRTACVFPAMDLNQCQDLCRKNCSCQGFSNSNIENAGSGCVIWLDMLYDVRRYAPAVGGQSFYLRVPASDLEPAVVLKSGNGSSKTKRIIKITGIAVGIGISFLGLVVLSIWMCRRSKTSPIGLIVENRVPRSQDFLTSPSLIHTKRDHTDEAAAEELDLPLLDFSTIVTATNNFSTENKLGQGGFGSVYKGVLVEGHEEVAVKRLSKNSCQGMEEFKNEVKLIARLQHRNLVRLLGCCIEMEEKVLIYEYMENKSLDSILFKKNKSSLLDWQMRFNIICGVARGLLYLHQDSRFRIIHRDLKTSNVLLDKHMNPKISDFGMARIFGGDETEGNTRKVVGTYGYMSPEYAMDGLFSVKSDVFSFGVLVLEIVSGMKNRGFYQTNNHLNLLAYAWGLYKERRGMELMDAAIRASYIESQVLRCIQVGLLCVQEKAEDRPDMSNVVMMLSSDYASMAQPKNPGYCMGRRTLEPPDSSSCKQDESCTVNQVTITMVDGR